LQRSDLLGRQGAVIDADVLDLAAKARCSARAQMSPADQYILHLVNTFC